MTTILPQALNDLQQKGVQPIRLIDVRMPSEFAAAHVPFAENLPLDSLDSAAVARACHANPDATLYVICQKGSRGANACAKLQAAGLSHVINVEGGTSAWEQAGLPVVRGKQTISLERQVRIAAGLLVLVGAVLGYFVHPYWIALSAFVGAGLTFAGITDTCGMGLLLGRMPWNQGEGSAACSFNSVKG
jgi:rhodanese-related sulfurtransferase